MFTSAFRALSTIGLPNIPLAVPVTSGLVLRLDAEAVTGTSSGAQLGTWNDTSGLSNHAIRQGTSSAGFPAYFTSVINGKPAIRFNSAAGNTGDFFRFNRITTCRTVFWVIKETVANNRFLLGDSGSYDFHRGIDGNANKFWDLLYSHASIRAGVTKLMGNVVNGTTTNLPTNSFQLVSLVTTGSVSANQICQDRTFNGSWQGDIAEILIYDRALNALEENNVGAFLAAKYGLATAYTA